MRTVVIVVILLAACSKKDSSPRGLCERGCKKMMGCLPNGDSQLDNCITACTNAGAPSADQIEKVEASSCDELSAQFGGAGGTAPPQPTAPAAGNGCTADCRGCVGDNSSCYAAAGGANGIPCDPCCCAPGGPSPTWKTPE
jgi:hypothetical protein